MDEGRIWLIILVIVLLASPAIGETRVALVIGNTEYTNTDFRLRNPTNDADAISDALAAIGFKVTKAKNLDKIGLKAAIRDFAQRANNADVAFVYYSGHGVELPEDFYLIPTDVRFTSTDEVYYDATPYFLIERALTHVRGYSVVVLDACRDNPFRANANTLVIPLSASPTKSIPHETVNADTANKKILIAYAAQLGRTAEEGVGDLSPFAKAFVAKIRQPIDLRFVFGGIEGSVYEETGHRQRPEIHAQGFDEKSYVLASSPANDTAAASSQEMIELAYWSSVKDSHNPEELELYLKKFPRGFFSDLAQARLVASRKETAPSDVRIANAGQTTSDALAKCGVQTRGFLIFAYRKMFLKRKIDDLNYCQMILAQQKMNPDLPAPARERLYDTIKLIDSQIKQLEPELKKIEDDEDKAAKDEAPKFGVS